TGRRAAMDGGEAGRRAAARRRCASRIGDDGAGRAVGDLRDAAQRAGPAVSLQLRLVPRPRLQADAGREAARHDRQIRSSAQAVRLDPRDCVSVGKRDLRRGAAQLARAEAAAEAGRAHIDGWTIVGWVAQVGWVAFPHDQTYQTYQTYVHLFRMTGTSGAAASRRSAVTSVSSYTRAVAARKRSAGSLGPRRRRRLSNATA